MLSPIHAMLSDCLAEMIEVQQQHGAPIGFFQMSQDTMRQYADTLPTEFQGIPIYYSDRLPLDYVILQQPGDEVYD